MRDDFCWIAKIAWLTGGTVLALCATPAWSEGPQAEGPKPIPSTVPPDDVCRSTGPCDTGHSRPEHGSLANIGKKLANPLSDLWALTMSFNGPQFFDGNSNEGDAKLGGRVNIEPIMPFPLYGTGKDQWKLVTRPIIPVVFSQPIPTGFDKTKQDGGLGDIEVPLLVNLPSRVSGKWLLGAGPVWEFPTATYDSLGSQQFSVGPAVVAGYQNEFVTAVLFPNYFFGFADQPGKNAGRTTSRLTLLYVLIFNLPDAWQVGMNPTIAYDHKATRGNKWNVPVGLLASKTIKIGRLPINIKAGLEYSVISQDDFGQVAQFRIEVTPVVPGLFQKPFFGGK